MKTFIFMLLLSVCAFAQGSSRVVYLNYLSRELASDEENYDALPAIELGMLYGKSKALGHMVGIAGDVAVSATASNGDDSVGDRNVDIRSYGGRLAARYYFDTGTPFVQPFLGAGVQVDRTTLDNDASGASDDATSIGAVGLVGVESKIYEQLRLSAGLNMTAGHEANILDLDQTSVTFGVGWGF